MQNRVASLRKRCILANHIGAETTLKEENDVKRGKYNLVFGSLEARESQQIPILNLWTTEGKS